MSVEGDIIMSGWQVKPASLWVVYLAPFLVIGLLNLYNHLYPDSELSPAIFLAIYIPLEVLRITICLDIIVVRLTTSYFTSELQSLLIATPFLMAAIFFTFRLVGNIILPTSIDLEDSNQVLYFRALGRWSITILLLIASFVSANKRVSVKWTNTFIVSMFMFSVLLAILVLKLGDYLPSLISLNGRVTVFAICLGFAAMSLSLYTMYRYMRIASKNNDLTMFLIAVSMATAIVTEDAFIMVNSENDVFKLLGNVFGGIGFIFVFIALVQRSILIPYYNLIITRSELESSNNDLRKSQYELTKLTESLEGLVVQRTEQVRSLSKAFTEVEYRERRRFSQELHEDLQQILLGAKMQLKQHLKEHIQQNSLPEQDFEITESVKLLNKALHITRSMSLKLNPPILKGQGLDAALSWLSSYMKDSCGLETHLKIGPNLNKVKDEIQLMLTQMVRELLINVIKYSGVLEATVVATWQNETIQVIVSDTGSGFDVEQVREKLGNGNRYGLFTIEERLKWFDGKFEIESRPGNGTRCIITLPTP
jgi:signal transduction histidine kinase